MIVGMYMTREVEVIHPDASLVEGIRRMAARRIRRLVVTQGGAIVGMVCHRDIVRAFPSHINPFSALELEERHSPGSIATVMKRPVVTVERSQPLEFAAALMTRHHIGGLPVTQHNLLVGILTESDVFRALSALLSAGQGSARIAFDLTEDEHVLGYLVETTRRLGLELESFISFKADARRMAVAQVQGAGIQQLIENLWNSGHSVINVVRTPPED